MKKTLIAALIALANCKSTPETKVESALASVQKPTLPAMPLGLSAVDAPADNPLTIEKVLLGQKLFFDKRLSKDGTQACVNCHYPDKAYTSGKALDAKVGGAMNKRNAPSMLNLGGHSKFYWDGRGAALEATSLAAWKGQLGADPAVISELLAKDGKMVAQFTSAFQSAPSAENISKALASFFRALNNGNSAWDKSQAGDTKALSESAKAGEKLFFASGCGTCHMPGLFTDLQFHNVGVGTGAWPGQLGPSGADGGANNTASDLGRGDITKEAADNGKFKTPSLRNVALTAPYFHDGSVATLDEAIALMSKGGIDNPNRDPMLAKLTWSAPDIANVKAFLESLTGTSTFESPAE
jgi:cytochrome c peroxidase